jgi:hypothetical protein
MEARAAEALGALLHQVSSIKTRDISFQPVRRKSDILASIDVLGRMHKLVCNVAEPEDVKKALDKLRTCADGRKEGATPVLITRHASPQTRDLCEKSRVGFIDLDGNARIEVDEVFIGRRSVRGETLAHAAHRYSA